MGPLWKQMSKQPRISMAELKRSDLPEVPGVYALYRDGERTYVGKASELRGRVWGNHSGRGASMTGSAMRRNVAEHLGIATANEIKKRLYQPTPDEIAAVRAWMDECEITWIECKSKQAAIDLEEGFKHEHKPPLTKR